MVPGPNFQRVIVDKLTVALIRSRKPRGLEQLLRSYGSDVRAHLRSRFARQLSANECDQALWHAAERAWLRIETFDRRKGALRSWFIAIARNEALDLLRDKQTAHGSMPADQVPAGNAITESAAARFDRQLLRHPFFKTILRVLRKLPQVERTILKADWHAGGSAEWGPLASELGISKGNIRVRRCRGKAKIVKALEDAGFIRQTESGRIVVLPNGGTIPID